MLPCAVLPCPQGRFDAEGLCCISLCVCQLGHGVLSIVSEKPYLFRGCPLCWGKSVCGNSWYWCQALLPAHHCVGMQEEWARPTRDAVGWSRLQQMMQCRSFHSCLDREMRRACQMPAACHRAGLVGLRSEGCCWVRGRMDPALRIGGDETLRLCIVQGAAHVVSVEPKYAFRKRTDQMSYYCCSQCCPPSTTIHQGGSVQPYRKVPDTFLQQGQVLTTCAHLYPLTNSCLTSVLFKVAVVSSTGLLFKCPPTVIHNSPFPLLFLLCSPVTVTRELFLFFFS